MKHLLAAAACAPLLIACASAGAQPANLAEADEDRERRVLIINGERIELGSDGNAAIAIRQALREGENDRRIVIELDGDNEFAFFSDGEMNEFVEAMEGMAIIIGEGIGERFEFDFDNDFEFDFDNDFEFELDSEGFDGNEFRIHIERVERQAEHAAEMAERHAEHAAEMAERHAERAARLAEHHAERMAARIEIQALQAERMGERMAVRGLEAGVRGMERGIAGIDRVLDRGWYENDGERVELDAEKRAELEETRAELAEDIVDLREELEELRERLGAYGGQNREIRIERRDGSVRGWVNGREVTGSELDALLEGAPDAPEPPDAPEAP